MLFHRVGDERLCNGCFPRRCGASDEQIPVCIERMFVAKRPCLKLGERFVVQVDVQAQNKLIRHPQGAKIPNLLTRSRISQGNAPISTSKCYFTCIKFIPASWPLSIACA